MSTTLPKSGVPLVRWVGPGYRPGCSGVVGCGSHGLMMGNELRSNGRVLVQMPIDSAQTNDLMLGYSKDAITPGTAVFQKTHLAERERQSPHLLFTEENAKKRNAEAVGQTVASRVRPPVGGFSSGELNLFALFSVRKQGFEGLADAGFPT